MRLLVFSDVHTSLDACGALVEQSNGVDAVVGAGDFATMHRGLEQTVRALSAIAVPSVLVPGNNETEQALTHIASDAWPAAIVLHGAAATIEGVPFYGIGGGIPVTPFGAWSHDYTEDQARRMLDECPAGAVLVSHSPPSGHGDRTSRGEHRGSEAVLETIHARQPRLVVCGHIHDSWGYDAMIGPTRVINAGPAGVIVEL